MTVLNLESCGGLLDVERSNIKATMITLITFFFSLSLPPSPSIIISLSPLSSPLLSLSPSLVAGLSLSPSTGVGRPSPVASVRPELAAEDPADSVSARLSGGRLCPRQR